MMFELYLKIPCKNWEKAIHKKHSYCYRQKKKHNYYCLTILMRYQMRFHHKIKWFAMY